MKKLKLFGVALVLPLLFSVALVGCSDDTDNEPSKMIFQGDNAKLTIKSNFGFEAVFSQQVDIQPPVLFFSAGDKVSGTYINREPSSAKWNEDFVGTADIKTVTTDDPLLENMGKIQLPVSLVYIRSNGAITGLVLTITDANPMISEIGNNMMGGTYTLVN
jgi:hypothetical protein